AVASVLADKAPAASLPAGLVRSTLAYVSGTTANAGVLPAKVMALSEGVLNLLWLDKMKTSAGVVLALVLAGTGVGLVARQTWAGSGTEDLQQVQNDPPQERKAGPKPNSPDDAKS